jgi:hypothetical protein
MKVQCAWCKCIIKEDKESKENDKVSHGICSMCYEIQMKELIAKREAK